MWSVWVHVGALESLFSSRKWTYNVLWCWENNTFSARRFPALFGEILQHKMQWPGTPVLVATTEQKCKETFHKIHSFFRKKAFLSQHSPSSRCFWFNNTTFCGFSRGFGVMTDDVLSDAKLERSWQSTNIHKTSWYHQVCGITSVPSSESWCLKFKVPPAVQNSIWLKSISCLGARHGGWMEWLSGVPNGLTFHGLGVGSAHYLRPTRLELSGETAKTVTEKRKDMLWHHMSKQLSKGNEYCPLVMIFNPKCEI